MAVSDFFVWGQGGTKKTPDEIAREREMADAILMRAGNTDPVGHWTQGAARVVDALGGVLKERRAAAGEQEIAGVNKNLIASLLSGGSAAPASAPATSSAIPMTSAAGEASATAPAPAIDISGDKQTFIASLLPAAIEESKRTGVDPRIIVAQAAQETGWGKSAPGNNYFGIKSHGKGGGQSLMTTEYVDGKPVQVRDSFRGYGSPAESVRGYGDFILENPRYKPLREAQGLDAQLAALGASGYATDPNYASSVGSIARGIQLPTEVAAATPEAAIEAVAPLEPPVDVPAAPAVAEAVSAPPVQVAQASGINPAIIEALTDPRATEGTRRVAEILLQQQQEREQASVEAADPMRRLQLEKAQLEIDAMRNPQPNIPDSVQALNIRAQQAGLQPGTPEYRDFMITGGNKGITVDARQMGNIPPGYQVNYDAEGRPVSMSPIAGSPAAREAELATRQEQQRRTGTETSAGVVTQDIDRALGLLDSASLPTTGFFGDILSNVPGTAARDVRGLVDTIKANATFDKLQQMRAASPTGGALGAVSDTENRLLAAAIGNLEQSQSDQQFRDNLARVQNIYLDIIHGQGQGPERRPLSFEDKQQKPISEMTDEELEALANGD